MNEVMHDEIAFEKLVLEKFGLKLSIHTMIAHNIATSHTTKANVFLTAKHQLYVLIDGRAPLTLGDVQKMVKQMGLSAAAFVPPAHQPNYFDDIARDKFKKIYPGRHDINDDDLRYYRLSAPYNPALIHVDSVLDGTIKQFDSNDSSGWRTAAKFQYKRIKTL